MKKEDVMFVRTARWPGSIAGNLRFGLFGVLFLLFTGIISAQTFEGKLSVTGFPRDGKIKESQPADLYKSFRDGKYKINFSYKASGINRKDIVLFDVKTTVKRDGRTISSTTRTKWPFLPGDIFIPVETFDLVSVLQGNVSRTPISKRKSQDYHLPQGRYEVILEMIPAATWVSSQNREVVPRGKITPATFTFTVNEP